MRTLRFKTPARIIIFSTLILFSACSLAGLATAPFNEKESIPGTYRVFLDKAVDDMLYRR